MNPFKSRLQAIAFMCVSVAMVLAGVASIAVAEFSCRTIWLANPADN